jgi:ATP-dependent protease Clp ATPase subunit
MEEVMTDLMYEMPSKSGIQRIVMTEESITTGGEPKLFLSDDEGARQA